MNFSRYQMPHYNYSSYRYFYKGEEHVKRIIDQYVLLMVLEDTLTFKENGKTIYVKAGEWYIQRPGILQDGVKNDYQPKYYYIHFYGTENTDHLKLPIRGHFKEDVYTTLFDKLDKINQIGGHDYLECQITFLRILRNLLKETQHLPSDHVADQMASYLYTNYNKNVSIKEMSKLFNFSSDHLTRQFKKRHQMTPTQYLIMLRLEKAQQLLMDTDMPVQNIAFTIGYQDLSVFYKMFKKQTNLTPTVWREKHRNLIV